MGFSKLEEDTDIECHLCKGNGVGDKNYLEMLNVCHKCGGSGHIDWVAGVVKGSSHRPEINKDTALRVAHQNIHLLRHKIIDIGMEVGVHITVDIKALKTDGMMRLEFPKLIKIGD